MGRSNKSRKTEIVRLRQGCLTVLSLIPESSRTNEAGIRILSKYITLGVNMSYHQPDIPSPNCEDSIIREAITIIEHRYCHSALYQTAFTTPILTKDYLRLRMSGYEREVFAVMLLDSQHRLIAYEELFFGTIDAASVYPREVVKLVLSRNAAAAIFAHNHPSGTPEPSQADRRITERLKEALATIDVPALDHLVIGHHEVVSFAERGWI